MKTAEPPSTLPCSTRAPLFRIGKNRDGNWVVQDENCIRGGLFVDRKEALRFAMFENDRHPEAIVMMPGIFELNMNRRPVQAHHQPANTSIRRVA